MFSRIQDSISLHDPVAYEQEHEEDAEVVVMEPHSFEEMPQVIQLLRERKSVFLNLKRMDPEQAQRSVDFVAGGTYAIKGHQERVSEAIFLFTPNCVQVTNQSSSHYATAE